MGSEIPWSFDSEGHLPPSLSQLFFSLSLALHRGGCFFLNRRLAISYTRLNIPSVWATSDKRFTSLCVSAVYLGVSMKFGVFFKASCVISFSLYLSLRIPTGSHLTLTLTFASPVLHRPRVVLRSPEKTQFISDLFYFFFFLLRFLRYFQWQTGSHLLAPEARATGEPCSFTI